MSWARFHKSRGVILPAVLVLVGFLALAVAGFLFFVNAETRGTIAFVDGQQARLAAESGFEETIATLRRNTARHDHNVWRHAPDRFRHQLVFASDFTRENDPVREARTRPEALAGMQKRSDAWRYSVVSPVLNQLDDEDRIRFGLTPESSKLNINIIDPAEPAQLQALLSPLLIDLGLENGLELTAALLDWLDEDDDPREGGAESEYYGQLEPPYQAKNGPLDSVEELLLVKGFSAAVLWGEDVNRNGILDRNEDDGDLSFPEYDNADGVLNHGLAPFITVWSREPEVALDNKPRFNLLAGQQAVQAQIAQWQAQLAQDEQVSPISLATLQFLQNLANDRGTLEIMNSIGDVYVAEATFEDPNASPPEEDEGDGEAEALLEDDDFEIEPPLPQALANSPVTIEELPHVLDRFTLREVSQQSQYTEGLINLNTASRRVLRTIPGMTEDALSAIIAGRGTATVEGCEICHQTIAWPLMQELITPATFRRIAPYLTAKAFQQRVEVLGYADHVRVFRRYEWMVEMLGPVAQVRYYRDLTPLGFAWPVDRELPEGAAALE